MVKPKVTIQFDNKVGKFHPGETVAGKCCIDSSEEDVTQGIEIAVKGEACVLWKKQYTQGYGNKSNLIYRSISARETYIKHMVFHSAVPFTLKSGRNEFPFKFELPSGCPCTYHGDLGNVKYEFLVVIHRTILHLDVPDQHEIEFFVKSAYVLGSILTALSSATKSEDYFVKFLFCKSGPITLSLTINRSGYAPGEYIDLQAQITNNSTSNIQKCILSLQQEATFKADEGLYRWFNETIAETKRSGIVAGSSDIWQGNILQVPLDTIPTNLGGFCKIIQMEHTVKLTTKLTFLREQSIELPVIIGNWLQ